MKRLFIADDSESILNSLGQLLEFSLRCEVSLFSNGIALIEALETSPLPDLVISDYCMPHGSGVDVWNFIQRKCLPTPFILFTAFPSDIGPLASLDSNFPIVSKGNISQLEALASSILLERQSSIA